jgi:diguanylate cyclase (GGDEF)-like protein/PAS domain S-box-containing protein
VFIHAREGIMITDAGGLIIDVNQTFSSITGYSRDEVLGKSPRILRSNKHDPLFYAGLWHDLHANDFWSGEIWNSRKNGDVYPEHLTISVVRDEHGAACQFVALFSDISERKALEEQARKLAFYDSLTELPNRRLLDDRLAQAIASSKRSGCYCALMFLDLDNFKQLNDLHGHASGDLLLIEVAKRLTNCVREVDTVVRFGGDEFVVLLSQLDTDRGVSTEQAGAVAEKIRVSLAANYTLNIEQTGQGAFALEHRCSASIGVVVFASQNAAQADILKWADAAMYRAKDAGRNTIKFYGD